jgi:isopenicillin-N epimerase
MSSVVPPPATANKGDFVARGYSSIGSFQYDRSVDEMLREPDSTYVAPVRAVETSDLFDASSAAPHFGADLRDHFLVDKSWVYLNHGAFGGSARVALRAAQRWAEHAEVQPLRWFDRELFPLLVDSIRQLAAIVNAPPANIALVPHATYALSSVISSLALREGDVLFCLDVGYGSVRKMLAEAAARSKASLVIGVVPFPLTTPEAFTAAIAEQIPLGNTVLAVFDHVTSNSGLLLPAKALVAAAHARGARVLVDGAHGLGALDLDMQDIGADYYVSNAHKWLASAKGLAMLYVSPWVLTATPGPAELVLKALGATASLDRTVASLPRAASISHGYGSGFSNEFIWDGCRDYGAAVALPTLLQWWRWIGMERAREYCRSLLTKGVDLLCKRWGTQPHASPSFYSHMACVQLPQRALPRGAVNASGVWSCTSTHSKMVQDALHHAFSIEVPAKTLPGPSGGTDSRSYVRVSAFIYNTIADFQALADAVDRISWADDEVSPNGLQRLVLSEFTSSASASAAASSVLNSISHTSLPKWVDTVRGSLCPPVGNKMLFGSGQHKIMVVGGPNARADYHVEEGEEFFLQLEGDMELLIAPAAGCPAVAVPIRQGEAFMLPSLVPHSPQRKASTVGLVVERERLSNELDTLRWYGTDWRPLYEERFFCSDLGTQLRPVIERFNASEAKRTGVAPMPGEVGAPTGAADVRSAPPFSQPIALSSWASQQRAAGLFGAIPLWGPGAPAPRDASEYTVNAIVGGLEGAGETWSSWARAPGELFLYQFEGGATAAFRNEGDSGDGEERELKEGDVVLLPKGPREARVRVAVRGLCLAITNPRVRSH